MRRQITFGVFLSFLAISLLGCGGSETNRNQTTMNTRGTNSSNTGNMTNSNTVTNVNSNTAVVQDNFWTNAAEGGMAEVEMGRLALQKSQNADVKKFAQMMVTDHTKANDELKALAAKKNVVLPTDTGSHKSTLDKLKGLSGAEFDKAYVDAMVEGHEDTVDLFEDNADDSDADIKAFATKTLPTLKSHLQMIKDIQSKMK